MADVENGTGEGQPADDIRSALAAAIATSEEQKNPPETAKPEKEQPKAEKAETKAAEGEAGADAGAGEAAKTEKEEAKSGDEPASGADKQEAKPDDAAAEKAETDKKARAELTGKWSAKDKETFAKLPPDGQELFLRRHKEMEGAFTKKTQAFSAFRNEYEPVDKLFEPWRDKMKASGFTPSSMIQAWANVEQRLMNGDGVGVVAGLIKGYKIDLGKLGQALGFKAVAQNGAAKEPAEADKTAPVARDPELERELSELRNKVDARERREQEEARKAGEAAVERVMDEIEKFKSASDKDGNLLHPHFDEVEEAMTSLATAAIATKQSFKLADLYEKAVWANPSTRDAMLAAREKAQREKADADARAKAAAARKAAASVTGAPGASPAPSRRMPERSLREELVDAALSVG